MSRAPRKPDGWEGPDDGARKALRLVEAPKVAPRGSHLFPFPAALAVAALVVSAMVVAGTYIWTQRIVMAPASSSPLVVVHVEAEEETEEESVEPVARQFEALPPKPSVRVPVSMPMPQSPVLPEPEVVLMESPFEVPENWEEADQPFPEPERPETESKTRREVAKASPPKSKPRPRTPVKRSPQVARQVPPVYPAAARRAGVEGSVLLQVAVQTNGRAGSVALVSSSGSGLLDAAAMRAVRKWSFRPATLDGKPVSGQVRVPVRFQLR